MFAPIHETDWKVFSKKLQPLALQRFSQRVLDEIAQVSSDTNKSPHEKYLEVYRLIDERDKQLADMFNNPRRSQAILQLLHIRHHKLLTDAEYQEISEHTREAIEIILGNRS